MMLHLPVIKIQTGWLIGRLVSHKKNLFQPLTFFKYWYTVNKSKRKKYFNLIHVYSLIVLCKINVSLIHQNILFLILKIFYRI